MTARSTGQTSKAAAETWAYEQLKKGVISTEKNISLGKFAENFWIWGKCHYIRSRLTRGANISRTYVDDMRTMLIKHILPYFENIKLQKIRSRHVEKWLIELSQKKKKDGTAFSATSVNRCFTNLKIILKESVRLEYLSKSPAEGIKQFRETPKKKSILTMDEVKELFLDDNIESLWDGSVMHYTLNLLSATTGMRLGECQGLQVQHVNEGYISVMNNWDPKYGLKEPKWRSYRDIPIPSKTVNYINELIEFSPYKEPEDFVFWGTDRKKPLRNDQIYDVYYAALKNIGISEEQRRTRNVTFHSWRHFYNTILRGKVSDPKLRLLTGHKSVEMSDLYTKFKLEDFKDVLQIQEEYFK